MRRREFALVVGGLSTWPFVTRAQHGSRTVRVGIVGATTHVQARHLYQPLVDQLHRLGWVDGKNLVLDFAWAEGQPARAPMVAAELVRRRPDVIVAIGEVQALAAKGATSTIPIVVGVTDAVDLGLIKSFAKPGGNITGINTDGAALAGKHVELLKLLIPRLSRVALLGRAGGQPLWSRWLMQSRAAAGPLGIAISDVLINNIGELDTVLADLAAKRVEAVIASPHAFFLVNAALLTNLSLKYRIALAHYSPRTVEAGALLGYEPDSAATGRRMAQHIDKILKGASPADIPVESPTRYKLAINLKTARLLGIEIPETILNLADRVIE